jgi:hypothetical protein
MRGEGRTWRDQGRGSSDWQGWGGVPCDALFQHRMPRSLRSVNVNVTFSVIIWVYLSRQEDRTYLI